MTAETKAIMTTRQHRTWAALGGRAPYAVAALALAAGLFACGSDKDGNLATSGTAADQPADQPGGGLGGALADAGDTQTDNPLLSARKLDYGEALREASLKLVGDLPAWSDIKAMASATTDDERAATYENAIDAMLYDDRFAVRMIRWWRDTLKTGNQGAPQAGQPDFDTAAVFAAMVVVKNRPYTDLFTATTGNCPTFDGKDFQAADCTNGAPQAGVLSNAGLMAQYYANMAFRRTRFVQETFACSKFPAEYSTSPSAMGASIYTSPWAFESISGGTSARVNFQDTSSVICANCHTTINHIAPLFANFDMNGNFNAAHVQVETPIQSTDPNERRTVLSDWLPAGQQLAWRNGVAVSDIPSLGRAMAADPVVQQCAVNRVWNWAFSRGDIVNDLATIPPTVTADLTADFAANNFNFRRLIRQVFLSPDFVRF
jgi:hypothetical protein